MKKNYITPKCKAVKIIGRSTLLEGSAGSDYTVNEFTGYESEDLGGDK